jgi:transcription elongation GreA/GreB family factor
MPFVRLLNRDDRDRVQRFISLQEARLAREEEALALLSSRLERCQLIDADDCPADVVTMHSHVRMRDADSGRIFVAKVALPRKGAVSGSASLRRAYPGIALLGARIGDDIVWRSGGRLRRARIERILSAGASRGGRVASRATRPREREFHPRSMTEATPRDSHQARL